MAIQANRGEGVLEGGGGGGGGLARSPSGCSACRGARWVGVGEGGWGRVGWSDFGQWPAVVWSWPGRIDRAKKERKGKMDEGNGDWAWSLSSILFYYFQPHEFGHPRLEKEHVTSQPVPRRTRPDAGK